MSKFLTQRHLYDGYVDGVVAAAYDRFVCPRP